MIHIYDNDKQMIAVVHDFISQEECEEILAHSWQNMERSTVASKDGKGQKHDKRTGSNTWLQHDASPIIKGVADRISQMVRMPLKNAEPFQVVYYKENEEYDYHWDSFDESDDVATEEYTKNGGQRLITVLGYLRDVPKGGETGFNHLGVNIQPRRGSVIVWWNVEPNTTKREIKSQHAGLPVLEGEKYAFNLWFRENEFKK
jgi:prolyl 4-hydroxylase